MRASRIKPFLEPSPFSLLLLRESPLSLEQWNLPSEQHFNSNHEFFEWVKTLRGTRT